MSEKQDPEQIAKDVVEAIEELKDENERKDKEIEPSGNIEKIKIKNESSDTMNIIVQARRLDKNEAFVSNDGRSEIEDISVVRDRDARSFDFNSQTGKRLHDFEGNLRTELREHEVEGNMVVKDMECISVNFEEYCGDKVGATFGMEIAKS